MAAPHSPLRHFPRGLRARALAAAIVLAAVGGGISSVRNDEPEAQALRAATSDTAAPGAEAAPQVAPARPGITAGVRALSTRYRPDVSVTGPRTFSKGALRRLSALSPGGGSVVFRAGKVQVAGKTVRAIGVDPSSFRAFTAKGTAEATPVWQAVARGEVVASHEVAKSLRLELGQDVRVVSAKGGAALPLRLGAMATTGVPNIALVVDDSTARRLGLPTATGMLLTAAPGQDPVDLAARVDRLTGDDAEVDLLTPPAANPVAFLTGSRAARAFGAFSYRYYPDGTIEPDARWVRENIVTAQVPIFGRVTCHRLMVPQLRRALEDIVEAGLAGTLSTYDGCYVPRFIERNPNGSISLHTWGIAIDFDASTNYRGIQGDMHPEVVAIFKRWGFRWGGDWSYTDPMHFELGALLNVD